MSEARRIEAIRRSGLAPNMGDAGFDRHCRVAQAAVGAESIFFSVVDEDRQFFPSSLGLVEPYATTGETPLTHSFCKYVVERSSPLIIADADDEPLVAGNLAQRDMGIASYAGVPVTDDEGNVLGALCAAESVPRNWTAKDIQVLTDVSRNIESELHLHQSRRALEGRLADEQLAQEYERAINQLARAANQSQTVQGVAAELAQRVAPAIGATLTSIGIVGDDGLEFTHGTGVPPEVAALWKAASIEADVPMAVAVTTGNVVHLADQREFDLFPEFAVVAGSLDLGSFRAIPFGRDGAGVNGVLGMGWAEPMEEDDLPGSLDRIVDLAETTLTRAWRFEIERDQARVLERVVLPTSLPNTGIYDVAGRYIAPDLGQRVGGDVYDVLVRSDGAVGVMVADAVGHDLTATRAVARLRHAIGVLIMEGYTPAQVMTAVDAYVAASAARRLVTCVCLLFEPDGSAVTIANAGHPQPILQSGAIARPVGPLGESLLGRAATSYSEVTVELDPGDLILSFTDGLIDRRGTSFIQGERWLVDFVENQPDHDAHSVANRLEAELMASTVDDDMAFLIVSRPAPLDHRTIRWSGPAAGVSLADRRAEVSEWLAEHFVDRPTGDVLLVTTELLTNAREASNADNEIGVTLRRVDADDASQPESIEIVVTNLAPPFDSSSEMPDADSVRGRGLAIVEHVARTLDISVEDGTVTARAVVDID